MSNTNPIDEWFTGEYGQTIEPRNAHVVVPKARPAPGKYPSAQAAAIADVNERYTHVTLNDDVPL